MLNCYTNSSSLRDWRKQRENPQKKRVHFFGECSRYQFLVLSFLRRKKKVVRLPFVLVLISWICPVAVKMDFIVGVCTQQRV